MKAYKQNSKTNAKVDANSNVNTNADANTKVNVNMSATATATATSNFDIVAVFTESGVILDTEAATGKNPYQNDKLLAEFALAPYNALLHFGFADADPQMTQSLSYLHKIASLFVRTQSRNPEIDITRSAIKPDADETRALIQNAPYAVGAEHIGAIWVFTMWENLSKAFDGELSGFDGDASQYLLAHNSNINVAGRVFFHLVENNAGDYPFAFLATYSRKPPGGDRAEHVPLKNALHEYKDNRDLLLQLLTTVSRAADRSEFISELTESGELFSPLRFTVKDAYAFLREIPLYEECGIMCRIPDWWKKKYNKIGVSAVIGEKQPSRVGLDALLSFNPALTVDGVAITREELEELISQSAGLSLLKGKWVEVDHDKLRAVLDAYDKLGAQSGAMSLADALRMQMGLGSRSGLSGADYVEVTNGQWLNNVMASIKTQGFASLRRLSVAAGGEFKAVLRKYQQEGLDWLATMKSFGFGALLADDMGLGKTVQILALLEYLRGRGTEKSLLIIPASLIGNWSAEIDRFTPKIRYRVLHAQNTSFDPGCADLFITTYGMAARLDDVRVFKWDNVIIDEAQAIKNPGTIQTKAVKSIPAGYHIAMTGTPVENRMSDLWSIFDFLNAGLLGTATEFSAYAKRIQNDGSYYKLRNAVSPFILRRLKTDKSIINDLPDKVEMKVHASFSKKQAALYTALVREMEERLNTLEEGIGRRGAVLAGIMKFKQICNHPDHYLGQAAFDPAHSGKFRLLAEICETIRDKRERMLVFTQFREMCEPLSGYLQTLFGRKGLVLHGGTPVKKRAELVARFNGDEYTPYMVLSLKAGGVGLNLTAANHVVHFDRWWNPAVENQATDRAFRISQKKNVLVHKFVTAGTVEEKIDKMIEDKIGLAGELIAGGGENWITELDNGALMNLFRLDA